LNVDDLESVERKQSALALSTTRNASCRLRRSAVSLGTGELTLQVGECIDDLGSLEGAIALAD
jgi:hypothetical protein